MEARRALTLVAVALAAALAAPAPARADCAGANAVPRKDNAAKLRKAVVCLVNQERSDAGLSPLSPDKDLTRAARRHSLDMVARGFFDHVSPAGSTMLSRITDAGYLDGVSLWKIGENIACGAGSAGSPAAIVRMWMDSLPHRLNLLLPTVRDVGVGVAPGLPDGGRGATYTLDLGLAR